MEAKINIEVTEDIVINYLKDLANSISVWVPVKFIAVILHTCKQFQIEKAIEFTRKFFKTTDIVYKEF
jgi:hypothetical protein